MADILIRGTYFPRNGHRVFRVYADGRVEGEYSGIPLGAAVELPEHGDLIDKNLAVIYEPSCFNLTEYQKGWNDAMYRIKNSPVIVPSNKEEST